MKYHPWATQQEGTVSTMSVPSEESGKSISGVTSPINRTKLRSEPFRRYPAPKRLTIPLGTPQAKMRDQQDRAETQIKTADGIVTTQGQGGPSLLQQ